MHQLAAKAVDPPLSPNLSRRRHRGLHGHQRRHQGLLISCACRHPAATPQSPSTRHRPVNSADFSVSQEACR